MLQNFNDCQIVDCENEELKSLILKTLSFEAKRAINLEKCPTAFCFQIQNKKKQGPWVARKMLLRKSCSIAATLVRTWAGASPASRIFQLLLEPGSTGGFTTSRQLIDKVFGMFVLKTWRIDRL
jgi:hypothetical protein